MRRAAEGGTLKGEKGVVLVTMYAPELHVHPPHVGYWPVAVIGLPVALVALGSWVLIDRYAGGGGATQSAAALIDGANAAISNVDARTFGSFYTPDAVITRDDGGVTVGPEAIHGLVAPTKVIDYKVWRVAPVPVEGDFATTFLQYPSALGEGIEPAVYQLRDGKILRMWFFELGTTPPCAGGSRRHPEPWTARACRCLVVRRRITQ